MEKRERDEVSSDRVTPTEAGKTNRETSEREGREKNRGTDAEFGQSIGRAEEPDENSGRIGDSTSGRH